MSTERKPRGIPFIAEFANGGEREARMELQRLQGLKAPTPAEAALRVELERYLADPFTAAALDQERLLAEADQRAAEAEQRAAPYREGRTSGTDREAAARIREHIVALRAEHPQATSKELRAYVDTAIVPTGMSTGRWDNLVSKHAPRRRQTP